MHGNRLDAGEPFFMLASWLLHLGFVKILAGHASRPLEIATGPIARQEG